MPTALEVETNHGEDKCEVVKHLTKLIVVNIHIQKTGYLIVQLNCQPFWLFCCLVVLLSGCPVAQLVGSPIFRISGGPDV